MFPGIRRRAEDSLCGIAGGSATPAETGPSWIGPVDGLALSTSPTLIPVIRFRPVSWRHLETQSHA